MPVTNETLSRSRRESQLVDDVTSDTAERLIMTEKLIKELNETWEEKIRKSEEIRRQRFNTFCTVDNLLRRGQWPQKFNSLWRAPWPQKFGRVGYDLFIHLDYGDCSGIFQRWWFVCFRQSDYQSSLN